ncbi:MAG: hypothetical protein K2N81_00780, partial [Acetatifactor sp.]|nr:hypothetical protein [Acetatifactor sp.]
MKRLTAILLVCGVLCVSLTSCGRPSDRIGQESVSAAIESDVQAAPGMNDDNLPSAGDGNAQGLSEDYVYDYQVSMDPIPKEIADLGGPCQGTIHAFPSKIVQGLTQKQIEEDLELKKEVEETIPKVERYLTENIGEQFIVDGLEIRSECDWSWICTEVSTGYQFSISYLRLYSNFDDNHVFLENYYNAQITEEIAPEIEPLIKDVFGECN